jgi:uncharacterized FlaG/YvyC family protein
MTPTIVSSIDQALPLPSNTPSNSLPQDGNGVAAVDLHKDNAKASVDTISISEQSRQAQSEVKNAGSTSEEAKKKVAAKTESTAIDSGDKPHSSIAKVQFVYNLKGEISVRYLDTANNLIYQVPSELMMQMKEAASKAEASVNTKA